MASDNRLAFKAERVAQDGSEEDADSFEIGGNGEFGVRHTFLAREDATNQSTSAGRL